MHLVGHSLGGMESATLAGRRPDRIASLTLLAPAAASVDEVANGKILGRPYGSILAGEPFDVNGQALGPAFVHGMEGYDAYAGLTGYRVPCSSITARPTRWCRSAMPSAIARSGRRGG